ncbi:tetratricopeptide repeat protein [Pricia sp.]|uniref:tetratricopeptide repeat protein n=1 Tax=Pricia sp. TaxID=2268138 RepID=UPI003593087C
MQKALSILLCSFGFLVIPFQTHAQENPTPDPELDIENSAEVFLEAYSDDFQENFFAALKQKGIENYDKAINLFLKCKQLDTSNPVIDHELAKAYFETRQYPLAEEYALTAVTSEPENVWYADTLTEILQKQGKTIETMTAELPFDESAFSENLASIYFKKGNYETALAVLKKGKQSDFTVNLTTKINDSIEKLQAPTTTTPITLDNTDVEPNPLEEYKIRMESLIQANNFPLLQQLSEEALESYPAQPYFYFAQGYALNKTGKHQEAVETLEAALDYLIDDTSLENKIYQELVDAYTSLNNAVKANAYLRKIKPGF